MAELKLKSYRFRAEREDDWLRLERLLAKVEKRSVKALTDDELLAAPVLYRQALSSLSVARATSLDLSLVEYLESLSSRAYFFIYGVRSSLWTRIGRFFAFDWPAAARALGRETLVGAALLLLGLAVGFWMTSTDPDWVNAFVPSGLAGDRGPSASTEALRATLHGGGDKALSAFATFLFTHNAGIAILAFALGFAFCLPTALLLLYNGCTVGAFLALFVSRGLGVEAFAWLMIHGVTELGATVLAGAAGMRIGWTLAFPGDKTRVEAVAEAGRTAAVLMGGVLVMLFCAGLLEGIGRQLIESTPIRYAVAAGTAILWPAYLYLPRAGRGDARG